MDSLTRFGRIILNIVTINPLLGVYPTELHTAMFTKSQGLE